MGSSQILIQVDWIYFLGIIGALIAVAWYSNGRFTKIETSVGWIEKLLQGLKLGIDNKDVRAFETKSPVALTDTGKELLKESGVKKYVDNSLPELFENCEIKKGTNPYEVQQYIFDLFNAIAFPPEVDKKIKTFAYEKGIGVDIVRRVGAIYFRDICLDKFDMKVGDIDKHQLN